MDVKPLALCVPRRHDAYHHAGGYWRPVRIVPAFNAGRGFVWEHGAAPGRCRHFPLRGHGGRQARVWGVHDHAADLWSDKHSIWLGRRDCRCVFALQAARVYIC
jgi:hypothetical protein